MPEIMLMPISHWYWSQLQVRSDLPSQLICQIKKWSCEKWLSNPSDEIEEPWQGPENIKDQNLQLAYARLYSNLSFPSVVNSLVSDNASWNYVYIVPLGSIASSLGAVALKQLAETRKGGSERLPLIHIETAATDLADGDKTAINTLCQQCVAHLWDRLVDYGGISVGLNLVGCPPSLKRLYRWAGSVISAWPVPVEKSGDILLELWDWREEFHDLVTENLNPLPPVDHEVLEKYIKLTDEISRDLSTLPVDPRVLAKYNREATDEDKTNRIRLRTIIPQIEEDMKLRYVLEQWLYWREERAREARGQEEHRSEGNRDHIQPRMSP